MNILLLGSGGREHALAWAIKQNPKCDRLVVAPGNAGIAGVADVADLDILDGDAVASFALEKAVDLVIIGPEAPLAAGVADRCRAVGLSVFGPSAAASRLEASKAFTKEICAAVDAPTAASWHVHSAAEAREVVRREGAPIVVKADGLAAGKGVTVAPDLATAEAAIADVFANPGSEAVIEEMLTGEEASLFCLVDGREVRVLGTAQDHKRVFDGDEGPNTGGMGAYSPAPILDEVTTERALDRIVRPMMAEMVRRGSPYQGLLYAGLIIEDGAPKLIEYNVRFGDPEAQVLAMRLGGQMLDLIDATVSDRLAEVAPVYADDHAMTVVLASAGYPGAHETGVPLRLPDEGGPDEALFHAGTREDEGQVVTAGGRVLNATARGRTLAEARDKAYRLAERAAWPGAHFRRDIGHRAL